MSRIAGLAIVAVLMVLVAAFPARAQVQEPPKTPTAVGTGGSASTVDPLATQTAIDVLRSGGNAVDAAVAAAGVLGVTEPFSCGIGGGGFMVIYDAKRGKVDTIDSREAAPAELDEDDFVPYIGDDARFQAARVSGLSVGVPGTVARLGQGAQALRLALAARAAQARPADRPPGLRHRRDVRRPGRGQRRRLRRLHLQPRDLPHPGRHRAAGRLDPPQPGHGGDLPADRPQPRPLLRGRHRTRHRPHRAAAAGGA